MSENSENTSSVSATLFSEVLFNIPRHNLITMAAYQLLNPNAKAKVDALLGSVNIMANNWGGWADQIKGNNPPMILKQRHSCKIQGIRINTNLGIM